MFTVNPKDLKGANYYLSDLNGQSIILNGILLKGVTSIEISDDGPEEAPIVVFFKMSGDNIASITYDPDYSRCDILKQDNEIWIIDIVNKEIDFIEDFLPLILKRANNELFSEQYVLDDKTIYEKFKGETDKKQLCTMFDIKKIEISKNAIYLYYEDGTRDLII